MPYLNIYISVGLREISGTFQQNHSVKYGQKGFHSKLHIINLDIFTCLASNISKVHRIKTKIERIVQFVAFES